MTVSRFGGMLERFCMDFAHWRDRMVTLRGLHDRISELANQAADQIVGETIRRDEAALILMRGYMEIEDKDYAEKIDRYIKREEWLSFHGVPDSETDCRLSESEKNSLLPYQCELPKRTCDGQRKCGGTGHCGCGTRR